MLNYGEHQQMKPADDACGSFFFVCVLVGCIPPPTVLDWVYTQACLAMDHSKEEPLCSGTEQNNRA